MRIIISPAKKMREDTDTMPISGFSPYLEDSGKIIDFIRSQSYSDLKKLWACNDKIAMQNYERFQNMDLTRNLTPAILAYDGIAYQYMAPGVFANGEFDYVQKNLRILSAFYGVLRPMDGVTPYRLEMQAKARIADSKDLYEFWGRKLYDAVIDDSRIILNLASKEYAKCIEKYLTPGDTYITCIFGEIENGKVVQKGVYAKMARGEMVRYMAEHTIEDPEQIKNFDRLGYRYSPEHSKDEKTFVFLR